MNNPFVTNGYVAPEYFCDREKETEKIVSLLTNENNVALISPRRIGKTDLLHHCFRQPEIKEKYHLSSASSVASAAKGLLEKDFITNDKGVYQVYDLFFKL